MQFVSDSYCLKIMSIIKQMALKNIQIYKSQYRLVRSDSKRCEQQLKNKGISLGSCKAVK
jgi:hypothetical protein